MRQKKYHIRPKVTRIHLTILPTRLYNISPLPPTQTPLIRPLFHQRHNIPLPSKRRPKTRMCLPACLPVAIWRISQHGSDISSLIFSKDRCAKISSSQHHPPRTVTEWKKNENTKVNPTPTPMATKYRACQATKLLTSSCYHVGVGVGGGGVWCVAVWVGKF